jgi:hypothetical protein
VKKKLIFFFLILEINMLFNMIKLAPKIFAS